VQLRVKLRYGSPDGDVGECVDVFDFPTQSGAGPWSDIDRTLHACDGDAMVAGSAIYADECFGL
jgi:hypothetical protein